MPAWQHGDLNACFAALYPTMMKRVPAVCSEMLRRSRRSQQVRAGGIDTPATEEQLRASEVGFGIIWIGGDPGIHAGKELVQ